MSIFLACSSKWMLRFFLAMISIGLYQNLAAAQSSEKRGLKGPITLHHEVFGSGRPVLLLHGLGASSFSWRHLIGPLSKNHKVIVVDLKGFGKSPKPRDRFYGIQDHADLIRQLIVQLNLRDLTLVGHSLGGAVALLTALDIIKNKENRLASLILIDSAGYRQNLPTYIDILRTPILGSVAVSLLSDKKKVRMILEKAYFDDKKITKAQVKAYAEPLNSPGGEDALLKTARKIIPPNIDELTNRYKEILLPTLIIWGKHDEIVPLAIGDRLHRNITNSQLVVIEKCGHIPHEERPDETLSVISKFLQVNR